MLIETVVAPPTRTLRPKYGDLIHALVTPGQWVRVLLTEVTGATRHKKQLAIQQAAKQAGIRVQTHLDTDHIYVCLRSSREEGA